MAGRRIPDWLIGLILAILLVVVGFLLFDRLGVGDDPAFEDTGAAAAVAWVTGWAPSPEA